MGWGGRVFICPMIFPIILWPPWPPGSSAEVHVRLADTFGAEVDRRLVGTVRAEGAAGAPGTEDTAGFGTGADSGIRYNSGTDLTGAGSGSHCNSGAVLGPPLDRSRGPRSPWSSLSSSLSFSSAPLIVSVHTHTQIAELRNHSRTCVMTTHNQGDASWQRKYRTEM